jgi:hypothetical protein
MQDKNELCDKITSLFPEIGQCGIDLEVDYNSEKKCWIIDLKKEGHELQHHLESADADACIGGKQCVSLGMEIAQLKENVMGRQF